MSIRHEYKAIEASINTGSILSINDQGHLIEYPATAVANTVAIPIKGSSSIICRSTDATPDKVKERIAVLFKDTQDKPTIQLQKHCYQVIANDYYSKPISLGKTPTATSELSKLFSDADLTKKCYFEWDDTTKQLTAHPYEVSLWTRLGARTSAKCFVPISSKQGLLIKNQAQANQLLAYLSESGNKEKLTPLLKELATSKNSLKTTYNTTISFASQPQLRDSLKQLGDKNQYCFEWNDKTKQLTAHPYKNSIWTKLSFDSSVSLEVIPGGSIRMQNQLQAKLLSSYLSDINHTKKQTTQNITDKFQNYLKSLEESLQEANACYTQLTPYIKTINRFKSYTQFTNLLNQAQELISRYAPPFISDDDDKALYDKNAKLHTKVHKTMKESSLKLDQLQKLIQDLSGTSLTIKINTQANGSIYTWDPRTKCLSKANLMQIKKDTAVIPIVKRLKDLFKDKAYLNALTQKLDELKITEDMGLYMSETNYKDFIQYLLSNGPFAVFQALETLKPYLVVKDNSSKLTYQAASRSGSPSESDSAVSLYSAPTPPSPTVGIQDTFVYPLSNNTKLSIKRFSDDLDKNHVFYELKTEKKPDETTYILTPKKLEDGNFAYFKSSKVFVRFGLENELPGMLFTNEKEANIFIKLMSESIDKQLRIKALEPFASPLNTIIKASNVKATRYNKVSFIL
ncbi:MAG: hypothetical protein WCG10_06890 [Chlamydiota bacterium]